jgi:hypothetical protein
MTTGEKFIVSADFGDLDVTDKSVSCLVIYSDNSKEHITSQEGLARVQRQIAAQQKAFNK